MAKKHLQDAIDRHLKKVGTDIETLLRSGKSPSELADDILRITEIEVTSRTIYRWLEDLRQSV